MYKANPKVNEELKQRLPSPVKRHCSETTPKAGFGGQNPSADIFQSTSETGLEKTLKGLNFPRLTEGSDSQPLPPPPLPPSPPSGLHRTMDDGMLSAQRTPIEPELKQDVVDNSDFVRPQCITPEPTATRRSTDEDHGNSKVSRGDARQVPYLDKEKNIAFLLKELDSLRDLNKKLQDKLALKQKELETIQLDSQLQEEKLEAHACERAAALVEEIYKAQRERDEAVMARLRLANEERDEALLRAKKLQEAALELEDMNAEESDMELEKLLNMISVADSALTIERSGIAIMQRIQKARERRSQITSEEMKTVIEERDKAITRCKRLEQQLYYTRDLGQTSSICPSTQSGSQEQGRKIQLDFSAVQNTVGQKSEEDPRPLCSTLQDKSDDSVKTEMSNTTAQNQSLMSRVQKLSSDLQATQTHLLLSQESEKEATEKVHKLERLVEVLRKKVGTGSVRTVI